MSASILDWALHYHTRGWSLIPIKAGTKKAALKSWKPYQTTRADEAMIGKWFGGGPAKGVAVILGPVSGGLVCRDFDTMPAYEAWATDHPELAKSLPTVATSRGRHVYFRAPLADLIFVDLGEGEYRGDSGHYCLLPESLHPDGTTYTWLIPPPDGDVPIVADVREAGLLPSPPTETTQTTETSLTPSYCFSNPLVSSGVSGLSVTPDAGGPDIDRAILETIPSCGGRRNKKVFELARALKAVPTLADTPATALDFLKPHVERWHKMGRERGVIGTEPFEETWIDFLNGWPKVKFPKGKEPMMAIVERAKQQPMPAVALKYSDPRLRLLVALCFQLHRASGEKLFYLSARMAARLLDLGGGKDHVMAWRWLFLLKHDKILDEVECGKRGKATRFRYVADEVIAA